MSHITVIFFDLGASSKLPGIGASYPISLFPVWGSFAFIDMALSNVNSPMYKNRMVFAKKEKLKGLSSYLQRWKALEIPILPQELTPEQFFSILHETAADHLLFYNVANAFLVSPADIIAYAGQAGKDTLKFSLNDIPLDMYLISKKNLKAAIKENSRYFEPEQSVGNFLFDRVLSQIFDSLNPLEGEMIFLNNLRDFFMTNLKVLTGNFKHTYHKFLSAVPQPSGRDTLIARSGWVRNSYVAQGGKVEGYVENSVIFENVHIKEKTSIINSVIMNGNQVGKNATIINTLIYPFADETTLSNTIGENVSIGTSGSKASNRDFPEHIYDGLTIIGLNPSIPDNCTVEPGCFIDADIPSSRIKSIKILKRGGSLLRQAGGGS